MNVAVTIARILVGFVFTILGLNGLFFFFPAPPISGDAGVFMSTIVHTHYVYVTSGAQVVGGVLLLINQYVRLALVVLAAVLVNILTYHITMMPSGLLMPLIVTALWFVIAWPQRDAFARFFSR